MRSHLLLAAGSSLALMGNAADAQSRARTVAPALSAREVATAREQHPQIIQEFGGAETGARANYVASVGRKIAQQSGTGNAGQAYVVTTLNSPVNNAFAVPGGYVYITRQLMGIMNDEAELASVLGHEVGHIAANHSRSRQRVAQRNSIGGLLGGLLGSLIGGNFGGLIARGATQFAQVNTASFSQSQEYESDTLGLRYITQAGYDPNGLADMLSQLTNASSLQARVEGRQERTTPSWASTHPSGAARVRRAAQEAQRTGRAGQGLRNRDVFLNALDGVLVDDDPRQGIVDGNMFRHPDLRLRFTTPTGYTMQNGARAVTVSGSAGQAQFAGGQSTADLQSYIGQVYQQLTGGQGQVQVPTPQRTTVNGIPAAYTVARVQAQQGPLDVGVFAYQWDADTRYHFLTIGRSGSGFGPFEGMVGSVARLSQSEASAIRARVLDVVPVRAGDTQQSLASRMAYPNYQLERFRTLNGLEGNEALRPGQRVKLIVYGGR